MAGYDLQSNESFVHRYEGVLHGGLLASYTDELILNVGIENIEFTPEARELVKEYSTNLMTLEAYEGVSQQSSNISAQQKIAQGVQARGLGDGGGTLFGMNLLQGMNTQTGAQASQTTMLSFDKQIETVKKMKELMDAGLLSEEEFAAKKREIMRL